MQFVLTDPNGVTLSCAGKLLGAPDCPARDDVACKLAAVVAPGQICIVQKASLWQSFSYLQLERYAPDGKNRIHVLVHFPGFGAKGSEREGYPCPSRAASAIGSMG